MVYQNTENSYGLVAKFLHWTIGLMIITMIIGGFLMKNIDSPLKYDIYYFHKATGTLLLVLVSIRLIWRLVNVRVNLPSDLPQWQKNLAILNINILYFLMFLMPISGFFMTILADRNIDVYGLFTIESFVQNRGMATIFYKIHEFTPFILCTFIFLHILATIYHHFIRHDSVFNRMWFTSKND